MSSSSSSSSSGTSVYSIAILRWDETSMTKPAFLSSVYDLTSFGFFQRSSAKEFIRFFSRTLIQKTPRGKRQSVEKDDYMVHCYLRSDGLGACFVSVRDYNARVAYTLMTQLLEKFHAKFRSEWPKINDDVELEFPENQEALVKYQNPSEADKISKIQKDLDETIEVVHKTLDSVLDRGDKLDNLVQQSEDLSRQSQLFYSTAASQNRCCVIM